LASYGAILNYTYDSGHREEGCKQCLYIERRDGGPPHSDLEEQIRKVGVYSWEQGQLQSEPFSKAANTLHANPTLLRNVRELCKF